MKNSSFLLAVVALALSSTAAICDISPTQYRGEGIRPIGVTGIRMASAKVNIDWGTPCALTAVFVMENKTLSPADIQLGFPVGLPKNFQSKDSLDFSMSFDGVAAKPSDITEVGKTGQNFPTDTTWYRCRHTFPPGQTTVTVTTKLPATLVYKTPYRECLRYCIETGASWEGPIGSEEVTISFPSPITPDQIIKATPASYTVTGNTIHWAFKDFKPSGRDHDIDVEYLRPDVATILAGVRAELAKDPTNTALKLKLAAHLFALDRHDLLRNASFRTEPESLVNGVLKTNPHNAEAWLLSIAYDDSETFWDDSFSESLTKKIKTTHKECPDDPVIQLLYARSQAAPSPTLSYDDRVKRSTELRAQLEKEGVYPTDYPHFDYGYW